VSTRAALACAAAALVSAASAAAPAAAAPAIDSEPPLSPPFRPGTPDYTVRCTPGQPVQLAVNSPAGTRVAIGGRPPQGGSFTAPVALMAGQAVIVRVVSRSTERVHYVRCLPNDFPRWSARRDGPPTARWLILTPSHKTIPFGYMAVFDDHGVPVWWIRGDPPAFNGELLPDGNLAWTRWVFGRDPLGHYEEIRLNGSPVRTYDAWPGGSNAHELRVLPNGNYFMVRYTPRNGVDLRPWGGPPNATVLDGQLQELDPAGTPIWKWSTADHVGLAETARWYPKLFHDSPTDIGDGGTAYDIAHVNSIDPFGKRVVISLRHTDAVYEIDRTTGAIVWKLGGTPTPQSLGIVGDPYGSDELGGQHDARVLAGGRTITIHENGTRRGRPPRALAFRIDEGKRTATLVQSVEYGPATESKSSGSARLLPDGHWVVSWGNNPYVTELTATGRPVLTIRFASPLFSYRAYPVLAGQLTRSALRSEMDVLTAP
jgi:hypothetical protein